MAAAHAASRSSGAPFELGRTLVIGNPAAQSGRGAAGVRLVEEGLRERLGDGAPFEVRLTDSPGHAVELAAGAAGDFDTVLALGGDGIIHEVVNGLMQADKAARPRLGIIPLGSGNDYARTLGMARNRPLRALGQILGGRVRRADLGLVNGTYFDNTLSFGLDAAIAADTVERRKRTGSHGLALWAASGLEVFWRHMRAYPYRATLFSHGENRAEIAEEIAGRELIFAIQVGPTYGGGFKVAPGASAFDGLLDVCYSVKEPPKPWTLALFLSARFGLHVHSGAIVSRQAKRLVIEFPEGEPPCQVDGEALHGTCFDVRCVPGALEVIVPA